MIPQRCRVRQLGACERGAAAVEFAIVALLLVLVSLGTIEFGRGLLLRNDLSYSADFAARKILNDPTISDAALENEVRANFLAPHPGLLEITIGLETVGELQHRTIVMSYPFTSILPGFTESIDLTLARRIPLI